MPLYLTLCRLGVRTEPLICNDPANKEGDPVAESNSIAQAREAKLRNVRNLMGLSNVVACGVGFKIAGDEQTDEPSVVVSVVQKVETAQLPSNQVVPRLLQGIKTDVIAVGRIRAFQDPKQRMRPARPGVSIGHREITAGTFGCLVRRGNEQFILSNNHVMANINNASVGDSILQPGPHDGGVFPDDEIATLEQFIPIDFGASTPTCSIGASVAASLNALASAIGSHHRLQLVRPTAGDNLVDCAIARPVSADVVSSDILTIGTPTGVSVATLGTNVQKYGRTTGFTQGQIIQVDVTSSVNYGGQTATFNDQLMAGAMSQGGDSGSLVLDSEGRAVGLLFAGSDTTTIINPIQFVLDALNVEIVT